MNYVAIMGFGTVGRSVHGILSARGCDFCTCRILDRKKMGGGLFTQSFDDVLGDERISIAVECMGGTEQAYEYTRSLLEKGVNVVTSNKACVEKYGCLLQRTAEIHGVRYMYEAAVGGGIPCVAALRHMIKSDFVTEISGILNGTSNSILCAMENLTYEQALGEAIALGVAEADPSDDVSGLDSARKLAILCRVAWGIDAFARDIKTVKGIQDIGIDDIAAAAERGEKIRLVATAKRVGGALEAKVEPICCPNGDIFASARGTQNVLRIGLKYAGEVTLCGFGAGGVPTASAVVADMYQCLGRQ